MVPSLTLTYSIVWALFSFIHSCFGHRWSFCCNAFSSSLVLSGELLFCFQDFIQRPPSLERFYILCQEQNVILSFVRLSYNTHHISPLSLRIRNVFCSSVYLQPRRWCCHKVKWKCRFLSHVRLFPIPWTVAHQAPLSMGFSKQDY